MEPDLIYDVGMGSGDDTAHYLSEGYRVVAVEASPTRCESARRRFAIQSRDARLTIEQAAISDKAGEAPFYLTTAHGDFSALDRDVAARDGHEIREIAVRTVPLGDLFARHGVPYYLKVDIEGADGLCLEALQGLADEDLPRFVSVEAHRLEYLCLLWSAGYRRFKVVDQTAHNDPRAPVSRESAFGRLRQRLRYHARANPRVSSRYIRRERFAQGASGPFGDATPGAWQDLTTVAYEWLHAHHGHRDRGHLDPGSWFDFHAALPE